MPWSKSREARRRQDRRRDARESRKLKNRQRRAAYAARNSDKVKAWRILNRAILKGTPTRKPCEVCGHPRAEAHRVNYSNPLGVRWLCIPHHRELTYPKSANR
jgi:hypothetical protein